MVLYGITIILLAEELWAADLGIIYPFYADDAVFDRSANRISQFLNMLIERGLDQGYFRYVQVDFYL